MNDRPPRPRNRGRLVLVLFGIAVSATAAWLVVRSPRPPVTQVTPTVAAPEQPLSYYLARADAARGETGFGRCAPCHTSAQDGRPLMGPNLYGVMGRAIASQPGFAYSEGLRAHGGTWSWEAANAFLHQPRVFAPGTRMGFGGISDPQDRADLMLYLNRQGGSLPTPAGVR